MLAEQEFHETDARRAELTRMLVHALDTVSDEVPAVPDDLLIDAGAVLAVLHRTSRARPLEPHLARAAARLSAALPEPAPATTAPAPAWGLPVDVLHGDRTDLIGFTRTLVRATAAGRCLPRLPRPVPQLLDHAEGGLGGAVAAGDHELVARLLATWPLLGAPWTAPARCALDDLLAAFTFPAETAPPATAGPGDLPAAVTTAIAVALLLALALEHGRAPETWTPNDTDLRVAGQLGPGEPVRDAALAISAALRAAARGGDRVRLRAVLAVAVACGVSADAAVAATLDELCGLSAFALAG